MSLITNAYIVGNNKVNSSVSVALLSDVSDELFVRYQWYRSSTYDGIFEKIDGATSKSYIIRISDRYLLCEVTNINNPSNIVDTNTLVVNQLDISNTSKNRSNTVLSHIGKGISYDNPVSSVSGSSNVVYDVARINQSINLILSTARGEVPMIPSLGTVLHQKIFGGTTDYDLEDIKSEVEQSLSTQEPRINLINVIASYDEDHTVVITVDYNIVNTNIRSQYIYKAESGGDVYE